jgi:hypothetical protein
MLNPNAAPPPMLNPNAPPPAVGSRAKKGRAHRAVSPNAGFDDMFAEGAQKSAAQDFAPSRHGRPKAPPPKVGGPAPPSSVEASEAAEAKPEDLGEPGDAEET